MITTYRFDPDTGELYEKTEVSGPYIVKRSTFATMRLGPLSYTEIIVSEGMDARREMFNHFGDDSSWPTGWWNALNRPQFTRRALMS